MPKRGVIAIILTTGALVLLLSFRTPDAIDRTSGADAAVAAAAASAPPAAVAAPTTAPTLPGASATPAPAASTGPTPAPVTAAPTAPVAQAPTAAPSQAPTTATTDGTILGDAVGIRWGTVQVQVTVADGRITDVVAVQLPDDDPRSSQISSYAEPALRESALASQSASIDYVSGATFTSRAYAQSLQSALDQARAQG
jgi:uncharacterized protein with FMN-binding domain